MQINIFLNIFFYVSIMKFKNFKNGKNMLMIKIKEKVLY